MSKRKTIDKTQARERRNRMLDAAASAQLPLTEGVREMRAIAGMTQEEFAKHRGVSARAVKTIELGQGNPTVATLNRIGQFFGLEVAFVPIRRTTGTEVPRQLPPEALDLLPPESVQELRKIADFQKTIQQFQERLDANTRMVSEAFAKLSETWPAAGRDAGKVDGTGTAPAGKPAAKKRKPRSS